MSEPASTRTLAVTALAQILSRPKKPKDVLDGLSADIDKRERAFLMEIVYGVLRHRDLLDWMFRGFLKKPSGLSPNTINNLRAAVYQIKFMRVPHWAVVDEAVETEKICKGRPALVNAVLRNFLRYIDEIAPPPREDPADYISVTTSHPLWLVKRWIGRFGPDEALKLAEKNNEMPPFTIRVRDSSKREETIRALSDNGIKAVPTAYSPSGVVLEGPVTFNELSEIIPPGYIVQDEAAQLVTFLLGPLPGERVLDACAAPGGKTTHLAHMMEDRGEITAVESEVKRIRQIEENISRLGLKSIRIIHGDLKNLEEVNIGQPFDKILLDAPCSSLGVIRRNPDVKYRHSKKDMLKFSGNQGRILSAVSGLLKSGGIMVYSVCSTEPEEGEEVIDLFLQKNPDFSIIEDRPDFLAPFEVRDRYGNLYYRTFPHRHNMDGFFAAKLRKR